MEYYCCCRKQEQFVLSQLMQEQIQWMKTLGQVLYYWMGQLWWLLALLMKWKKSMEAQSWQLRLWQIWWMLCSLLVLYLLNCQSQAQLRSEHQAYCYQYLSLWMMRELSLQQRQDLTLEWHRYSQQDQHFDSHYLLCWFGCFDQSKSCQCSNYC